jgi:hypothetical protein
MVSRNVHFGSVGVSTSFDGKLVLLQVTDDVGQSRASMTPKEAMDVIARLREAIRNSKSRKARAKR